MSKEKNNSTLKIFSLIIAIVLWSYVMSEVNPDMPEEYRNIDVTFTNMEALDREGLMIMEPKEVTISVEVTGKRSDMLDFSPESIKAQVDLGGYGEGQKKVPVDVTLDQFSKVKITNYKPKEIVFTFDRRITREKTVEIETIGKLDPGYALGEITAKSQTVLLKGPRTWLNEVSKAVAIVDITGRQEDGSLTRPILLLDDQGNEVRGVENEPRTIDVNVPILRTAKVPIELQLESELPEKFEITKVEINPATIEIKGKKDILEIQSIKTKPININDQTGNIDITTDLELPSGVKLVNGKDKVNISLRVEELATKNLSYKLDELEIRNLNTEYFIDEDDYMKDINLTVKGNKSDIDALTKDDLKLYLDLKDLTNDTIQVYINFDAPEGITVKDINPQPIELRLIKNSVQ